MKKLIAIILLVIIMAISLTGCNKQILDTTYTFNYAIIELPNGDVVEGRVQSWTDFEDGDYQLRIGMSKSKKFYLLENLEADNNLLAIYFPPQKQRELYYGEPHMSRIANSKVYEDFHWVLIAYHYTFNMGMKSEFNSIIEQIKPDEIYTTGFSAGVIGVAISASLLKDYKTYKIMIDGKLTNPSAKLLKDENYIYGAYQEASYKRGNFNLKGIDFDEIILTTITETNETKHDAMNTKFLNGEFFDIPFLEIEREERTGQQ